MTLLYLRLSDGLFKTSKSDKTPNRALREQRNWFVRLFWNKRDIPTDWRQAREWRKTHYTYHLERRFLL